MDLTLIKLKEDVLTFEKRPRLIFLTVKGPLEHRSQKIGYVNNMVRKVSDNYFIVRETNKAKAGYHYHALLSLKKDLKPNWFRKGVHIHVSELATKMNMDLLPQTSEESWDTKYEANSDIIDRLIVDNTLRLKAKQAAKRGKIKKLSKVGNTLAYMFKELTEPKKYENYVLQ